MQAAVPSWPKHIFWDVDYSKIDFEKSADFVIVRIFERGDVKDIRKVRRFYGDSKVIEALTKSKYLFYHTFSLAKNMFDLNDTDFKCYNLNHSKGIPWTY